MHTFLWVAQIVILYIPLAMFLQSLGKETNRWMEKSPCVSCLDTYQKLQEKWHNLWYPKRTCPQRCFFNGPDITTHFLLISLWYVIESERNTKELGLIPWNIYRAYPLADIAQKHEQQNLIEYTPSCYCRLKETFRNKLSSMGHILHMLSAKAF